MYLIFWLPSLHTQYFIHTSPHTSPVRVGVCRSWMPQRELTSRENGAARSLHLVENRRKHFLPSCTAAVRNDSVRPEKTGTLFLFSSESSSVLWVYAGLHEVSMNAAFPPACAWNSDPRVQSSFIFSCFLLLIIPALAGHAPRSELWGDGPLFHFASAPPSLILWQHFHQFPLLCSSYKSLKETVAFSQLCQMQKVLGDRNKDPRLFLLFQYFQPPSILFAELRPYTSLPAKLTDKLTLQGSWFAEIADPTKSFSAAAQNMTRLVSVLGEERARCLWQVFFFP